MDPQEVTDLCEEEDFCLVCASAAFGLQRDLEEWTASSTNEQLAGEEHPKFSFRADSMDLACIVCKRDIFPPVMQVIKFLKCFRSLDSLQMQSLTFRT
jgi:hypothetical protein